MDLIDILLAKSMSSSGSASESAVLAQQAVKKANEAVSTIQEELAKLENNNTEVDDALARINAAIEAAESSNIDLEKLTITNNSNSQSQYQSQDLILSYDNEPLSTIQNFTKNYTSLGQNTDGSMTQKAITDAIQAINNISFNVSDAGKFVVISNNGSLVPYDGEITPTPVEPQSNIPYIGWTIDYTDASFTPFAIAEGSNYANKNGALSQAAMSQLTMYKRARCTVDNNGLITAWQNDANYTEDGSLGQVMIYQPKFYYLRIPVLTENAANGQTVIRKENIVISPYSTIGSYQLKLHPAFNNNGYELNYVLLPAFDGSAYNAATQNYISDDSGNVDFTTAMLSSIANVKPISGMNNNLTFTNAQSLAANRGSNWSLMPIEAIAANQLLFIMEFASLNGQDVLERGICDLPRTNGVNVSSQTGSTSHIGVYGQTNAATSTVNVTSNVTTTYTVDGMRAIQYRGMENPWGNIWQYVDHIHIIKNNNSACANIEVYNSVTNNYKTLDSQLTNASDWISGFGYSTIADWLFMPAESTGASSLIPVGDNIWVPSNANTYVVGVGGTGTHGDACGLFYYACDRTAQDISPNYGARLFYKPSGAEAAYNTNYAAWTAYAV